tara:strand:+ start:10025 stop:10630 length:606 start_codon:yes stop_codon:yes gene_type:complete
MTFNWYDDKIEKSILLALGMGFLGALGIKGLNRANEKSLVNKIINNPELIDELNEFKRKYDANPQAPLSSKTALNNAIEEIGIDKLRRIANQEMERLNLAPKMVDLDDEVQRRKNTPQSEFVKGDIMKEDTKQKEIRLRKELAQLKTQNANDTRRVAKNRDFSVGGLPPDTTHKSKTSSNDVPDVVLLPPSKRGRKENIPF